MAETKAKFPAPEDSDGDEVVLALETANALWGRGDSREAIRWLRRAAEAAEETGDDMRSLTLARIAADFTTQLEQEAEPATQARPPTSDKAPPAKLSPPAKPAQSAPASTPPPKAEPTPKPEPESVPDRDSTLPTTPPPPPPPPPPASSPTSGVMHASRQAAPDRDEGGPATGGARSRDALAQLAALASADAGSTTPRTRRSLGPYQALRVSVEPSKEDRRILHVRILNQSEEASETAYEALLVSMHPNLDMRSRKKS